LLLKTDTSSSYSRSALCEILKRAFNYKQRAQNLQQDKFPRKELEQLQLPSHPSILSRRSHLARVFLFIRSVLYERQTLADAVESLAVGGEKKSKENKLESGSCFIIFHS
jgi:hypothetical protein